MPLTYVMRAIILLAHLSGLVLSIILLAKKKGTPAILATVAFGLLFLLDIGGILRDAFLNDWLYRTVVFRNVQWAMGGLNCCCGIFDLAAIVCLIIALWQAVSGRMAPVRGEESSAEAVNPQE